MANEGNLKPFKKGDTEIQSMGGIASGESRRKKKEFRERLEVLYEMAVFSGDKKDLEDGSSLEEMAEENTSVLDAMALRVIQMALSGDRESIKLALSITGQLDPPKEEADDIGDGFLEALSGTAAQDWEDYNGKE